MTPAAPISNHYLMEVSHLGWYLHPTSIDMKERYNSLKRYEREVCGHGCEKGTPPPLKGKCSVIIVDIVPVIFLQFNNSNRHEYFCFSSVLRCHNPGSMSGNYEDGWTSSNREEHPSFHPPPQVGVTVINHRFNHRPNAVGFFSKKLDDNTKLIVLYHHVPPCPCVNIHTHRPSPFPSLLPIVLFPSRTLGWGNAVLLKLLAWHLCVLLLSTPVCCQPSELIWAFLFHKFYNFTPPPPEPIPDPKWCLHGSALESHPKTVPAADQQELRLPREEP